MNLEEDDICTCHSLITIPTVDRLGGSFWPLRADNSVVFPRPYKKVQPVSQASEAQWAKTDLKTFLTLTRNRKSLHLTKSRNWMIKTENENLTAVSVERYRSLPLSQNRTIKLCRRVTSFITRSPHGGSLFQWNDYNFLAGEFARVRDTKARREVIAITVKP